jgi:hypothetical protein
MGLDHWTSEGDGSIDGADNLHRQDSSWLAREELIIAGLYHVGARLE